MPLFELVTKETRSGSICSPPATLTMIRFRQLCTTRCAQTSWRAGAGVVERSTCAGPRWNVLTWRYADSTSHRS
ncbi:hypothetical protein VT52_021420 [Streptomyces malaysiense]|uniref:Uncharacterized protein n=1 Tax=Streptomyces malaysiense TaxID=1428626 RepID=A0A1J4PWX4_9ACTN|nr:hypothetical protein VT52_021420 [Streptomyces malaysiense]